MADMHTEQLRRIALYFREKPEVDHEDAAKDLKLSVNQVKHALDKMRKKGSAISGYIINLAEFGFPLCYRVDISVIPAHLRDGQGGLRDDATKVDSQRSLARYILRDLPSRTKLSDSIYVEDVRILLGHPADLSATVWARDTKAILAFVTEGLRMCNAVSQTSSCLEAWSCREGPISSQEDSH